MKEIVIRKSGLGKYEPLVPLHNEEGYDRLFEEKTLIRGEDGEPVVLFNNDFSGAGELLEALRSIRYHRSQRAEGLESNSRTFGFLPRVTIRRDFCTATALHAESPVQAGVLAKWADRAARIWDMSDRDGVHRQEALLRKRVKPEWILPGKVFTSGICNYNNPLRFHYDKGNFPGSWSAMFAFTHNVKGGNLVLPGYRIAFSFRRPSFIIFDGQANLHGVSPIKYVGKGGYRYSVVYYAMQGMCRCLTPDEELQRIRIVKTQREHKRAGGK